jgi:hypothetical protein
MGLKWGREVFVAEFGGSGSMQTFEYLMLTLVKPLEMIQIHKCKRSLSLYAMRQTQAPSHVRREPFS